MRMTQLKCAGTQSGKKRPERKVHHSPPSDAEVTTACLHGTGQAQDGLSFTHKNYTTHWNKILLARSWHADTTFFLIIRFYWQLTLSTFFERMSWVRHRPPVRTVSWWGPLQWVNPLQPSIRSSGQSFFRLPLCCCSSRGCNMGLLWFVLG
jgi:hypothetical protein